MDRAPRYRSIGDALTGVENRWDPTTWMMSPAVMYSFDRRTLARNLSLGTLDSKKMEGTSEGRLTGWYWQGCSSSDTIRSISFTAYSYASPAVDLSSRRAFTSTVTVCETRSKISSSSAIRKYIVGVRRSSLGGRGTTGSTSWMNS